MCFELLSIGCSASFGVRSQFVSPRRIISLPSLSKKERIMRTMTKLSKSFCKLDEFSGAFQYHFIRFLIKALLPKRSKSHKWGHQEAGKCHCQQHQILHQAGSSYELYRDGSAGNNGLLLRPQHYIYNYGFHKQNCDQICVRLNPKSEHEVLSKELTHSCWLLRGRQVL